MALPESDASALSAEPALLEEVAMLNAQYRDAKVEDVLRSAILGRYAGRILLVSSFGADSAVLLHMAAQIDPNTPVVFVDTGKQFPETLRYRDALVARLGLTNVQIEAPATADLENEDPAGMLWMSDTNACCHIRKVAPLDKALEGFSAWISGRKRFQSATRSRLERYELEQGRVKINPLADWTAEDILSYAEDAGLPPHPLVAQGFPSIGCLPCTDKVKPGEDLRAGRWRGQDKIECGIHLPTRNRVFEGGGNQFELMDGQ